MAAFQDVLFQDLQTCHHKSLVRQSCCVGAEHLRVNLILVFNNYLLLNAFLLISFSLGEKKTHQKNPQTKTNKQTKLNKNQEEIG